MCGRFSFSQSAETVAEIFELDEVPSLEPRYNIAPSQPVPVVLMDSQTQTRQLRLLRWGLVPAWAKDPAIGTKLINARAETVHEKPAFRTALRQRRCLVLADGFYEWQRLAGRKQPFYFRLADGKPFAFAGLWEHWEERSSAGEVSNRQSIDSCTLLTTEANDQVRPIHGRMPVILDPQDYPLWLDASVQAPEALQPLLGSGPSEALTAYPVGTQVNNPANDSPDCISKLTTS